MKSIKTKIFLKNNIEVLTQMISDVTGLDYILLKDNINIKTKSNDRLDANFLIEFDKEDNIIIELNKNSYGRLLVKNIICLLTGIENKQKKIEENLKLIQIHLNYEPNCKKEISKYRIKEYQDENSYQSSLCIEISPIKCRELYKIKKDIDKKIKWGMFFTCRNIDEINEVLSDIISKDR